MDSQFSNTLLYRFSARRTWQQKQAFLSFAARQFHTYYPAMPQDTELFFGDPQKPSWSPGMIRLRANFSRTFILPTIDCSTIYNICCLSVSCLPHACCYTVCCIGPGSRQYVCFCRYVLPAAPLLSTRSITMLLRR